MNRTVSFCAVAFLGCVAVGCDHSEEIAKACEDYCAHDFECGYDEETVDECTSDCIEDFDGADGECRDAMLDDLRCQTAIGCDVDIFDDDYPDCFSSFNPCYRN